MDLNERSTKLLTLAGFTLLGATATYLFMRKRPKPFIKVGTIKNLTIYPIKTLKGIDCDSLDFGEYGVSYGQLLDRSFLLIDDEDVFITQRKEPTLILLDVELEDDYLVIKSPDSDSIKIPLANNNEQGKLIVTKVWGDQIAGYDCGDEISQFFSKYLGKPGIRLIRFDLDKLKPRPSAKYQNEKLIQEAKTKILYHDAAPLLVINDNSIDQLNSLLKEEKVTFRNFRPNILIEAPTFDEDNWEMIKIGSCVCQQMLKCTRCRVTTVNIENANFMDEPLDTLNKYRKPAGEDKGLGSSPLMGVLFKSVKSGRIRVGDEILASHK